MRERLAWSIGLIRLEKLCRNDPAPRQEGGGGVINLAGRDASGEPPAARRPGDPSASVVNERK